MEQSTANYTRMGAPIQAAMPAELPADLMRGLAHELRQPLSVIESAAYLAQMILEGGEPRVHEQLEKIQSTVHQINGLLCDLVAHQQTFRIAEPLPLGRVIADVVGELPRRAGVAICWQPPAADWMVRLTASQAAHMVRNVATVFMHLCGTPNHVTIALKREGCAVQLECTTRVAEDIWIRAEELLTPFNAMVPSELALALATVQRMAEASGGFARIDQGDGFQVRLRVTLPAC